MRKLPFAICIVVSAIMSSCDTNQASFDDSIPELYTLTTNVSPEESGTIHPSGGEFVAGNGIEIEARPSEGFIFDRWEDDLSGNTNPDSLFFTENRTVTAYFIERFYPLNIEIVGEGIVREEIVDESTAAENESVTVRLTAVPSEGWYFDRWEGNLTGNEITETIEVDEEKNITAVFRQEDPQGFVIDVELEGEGSIEFDPEKDSYDENEEVTVTAVASSGWNFIEWQGDLSGRDNPETIVMNEDKNITVIFEQAVDPNIEIVQQPSDTRAGRAISPAPELKLLDDRPEPLEGAEVYVTLSSHSFSSGSITTVTTDSNGIATFDKLVIETAATDYSLTFGTDDADVSDISSSEFDVTAADADPSNSSADVPDGVAGETTEIRITVEDRFGNPVNNIADELSVTVSGANNDSPTVSRSNRRGEYTASYTPSNSGSDQVEIELDGEPINGSPFNSEVAAGTLSASASTVTADPEQLQVGENSTVTIKLRDEHENPVEEMNDSDFMISVSGDATAGAVSESSGGTYQFDVTNETAEEVTVTITVNDITLDDTPEITFEAGEADEIEIIIQPEDSHSGQPVEGPPTVRVTDEYGNAVPDVIVSVTAQSDAASTEGGDAEVTTDESGTAEFDNFVITHIFGSRTYRLEFSTPDADSVISDSFNMSGGFPLSEED